MHFPRSFSAGEAATLVGLPYSQVYGWAAARCVVPAGDTTGRGNHRSYSFSDLVALKCAKCLREGGAPLDKVTRVAAYLRTLGDLENQEELTLDRYLVIGARIQDLSGVELFQWVQEERPPVLDVLDLALIVETLKQEIERMGLGTTKPAAA
jgi:DNA-binding transcriptional MerR regulator